MGLLNFGAGIAAAGRAVSQFGGTAALEAMKSDLEDQKIRLADQLSTQRETNLAGVRAGYERQGQQEQFARETSPEAIKAKADIAGQSAKATAAAETEALAARPQTELSKLRADYDAKRIDSKTYKAGEARLTRDPDILSPEAYNQRINIAGATARARADATNPVQTGTAPGTLGAPKIDVAAQGYAREIVPETGGLTQSAIDQAALSLATTGRFPVGMGIGSAGAGGQRKNAIQNRAAELNAGGNIAANAAQLSALTASLKQQTTYANSTERSIANAEKGFEQVITAFKGKVNNSQLPIVNAITNAVRYNLAPGDVSAFRVGLTEVANEYANVFSRGGIVTDAVREQAKKIADGNLSVDDLSKVFDELQAQGKIVKEGAIAQADKIQGQLNGILQGGAPSPTDRATDKALGSAPPASNADIGAPPPGVSPDLWQHSTPEERALWKR